MENLQSEECLRQCKELARLVVVTADRPFLQAPTSFHCQNNSLLEIKDV
jgi:hypothetical protein